VVKIVLKNLTKRYRGIRKEVKAVQEVNLEIKDKSFITLLGPSGCGKTSTLRMIAGLEQPTSGEIYFDDEIVNDVPTQERDLAMVFQQPTLFPFINVMDNMTYGLKIKHVPKEERFKRAKEAASLLHIEELLDRMPGELSGGERERVDLGRAIVTRPKVFLLDEPLASLDARLRDELRSEVRLVHKKLEVTTIFVTHDQLEAMTMSDEIAVMNKGRIEQLGSPNRLFNHPENHFVASFIGSPPVIFFDGSIKNDFTKVDTRYFSFDIPLAASEQLRKSQVNSEIIVGIRPDAIDLHRDLSKGMFQGQIIMIELLGKRWIFHFDLKGKEMKVELMGNHDFREGETVGLTLRREGILLFDRKSEKRLDVKLD